VDKLIRTYSLLSMEYNLSPKYSRYNFTSFKNVTEQGVYYSFMMICSSDNQSTTNNVSLHQNFPGVGSLEGYISFFNADGFLSGDAFYALQVIIDIC
jgi:hypothetical protein